MSTPISIGSQGTDGGSVTLATGAKLTFNGIPTALQGDAYVVPGVPPRVGTLQPQARVPKYMLSGRPIILDGDATGTGASLLPDSRFLKFQFSK